MKKFKWVTGRQQKDGADKSYKKMLLFQFNFFSLLGEDRGMDCYLIKYDPDYVLKSHKDPIKPSRKHFRLNIVLQGKGNFICEKNILSLFNTIILFRPDKYEHSMKNGNKERLVFSLGLAV